MPSNPLSPPHPSPPHPSPPHPSPPHPSPPHPSPPHRSPRPLTARARAPSEALPLPVGQRRTSPEGLARQAAARRAPRQLRHKRGSYHHGDLFNAALARARVLLEASGPEAITMRRLARDLGVSAPALHYHFRRKGELLACLAEMLAEEFQPQLAQAAIAESPELGMEAAATAFVSLARHRSSAYRLICREGSLHARGWGPNLHSPLAHFANQAIAGGGPALRAHQAAFGPPPPKRFNAFGGVDRSWYLDEVLHRRGTTLPTTAAQAKHGWLFALALSGLAQAEGMGVLSPGRVDELAKELPGLVLAAAAGEERSRMAQAARH